MESGHFHEEVTHFALQKSEGNSSAHSLAGRKSNRYLIFRLLLAFSGALVPLLREAGSTLRVDISINAPQDEGL